VRSTHKENLRVAKQCHSWRNDGDDTRNVKMAGQANGLEKNGENDQ
jgi:hypothetical protein